MHQTLDEAFKALEQFKWFNIKRCSLKGQRIITCVLQNPENTRDFWSFDAPDKDVLGAINGALEVAARKQAELAKRKG